jgi:Sulfotransferase domain
VLPNLIVAGAGKSGTTSLHLYLDQHPDIEMTSVKEPHFFSDDEHYATGPEFYADLFSSAAANARYRGESSTGYMIFPGVPKRICTTVPECRLVFLLRNPIDRAISHYRWLVGLGLETRDFRAAFESDRHDTPDPRTGRAGNYGYIYQEGCYSSNLDRFAAEFPADQMQLLVAEQLRSDPLTCLNQCCAFLGLEPYVSVTPIAANETVTLRHPGARARLEGRTAKPGATESRARTLLRSMLGRRLARRLRDAAVASLGSTPLEIAINVERSWLADIYAAEVASIRDRDSAFLSVWCSDFPA